MFGMMVLAATSSADLLATLPTRLFVWKICQATVKKFLAEVGQRPTTKVRARVVDVRHIFVTFWRLVSFMQTIRVR